MALELPIIPSRIPQMPVVITPQDLQPLIDKMAGGFEEGFARNQGVAKAATVGTSDAEAARAKNEATTATAQQDTIDQQGVQPKRSVISRLFGGGPSTAAAPAAPKQASGLQHLSTEELQGIVSGAGFSFQ